MWKCLRSQLKYITDVLIIWKFYSSWTDNKCISKVIFTAKSAMCKKVLFDIEYIGLKLQHQSDVIIILMIQKGWVSLGPTLVPHQD